MLSLHLLNSVFAEKFHQDESEQMLRLKNIEEEYVNKHRAAEKGIAECKQELHKIERICFDMQMKLSAQRELKEILKEKITHLRSSGYCTFYFN